MATTDEGFEDWDADFLDQLVQAEELALSSTNPTQSKPLPPPYTAAAATLSYYPSPPRRSSTRPPPCYQRPAFANYSPPRELSQRVSDSNNHSFKPIEEAALDQKTVQELEIERLKRELGRVSKQLTGLEQECLSLKNERDKKEKQLRSVFSKVGAQDAECHFSKNGILPGKIEQKNGCTGRESGVLVQDHHGISLQCQNGKTTGKHVGSRISIAAHRTIGVQTDKDGDCASSSNGGDTFTYHDLHRKLQPLWSSSSGQRSRRNFVAKLFESCAFDFCALLGSSGWNTKSGVMGSLEMECLTDMTLGNQCLHSAEAAGISTDMMPVEALLEILLELCNLENGLIVHRSLCILHVVLDLLLAMERELVKRDNVEVEGFCSGKDAADVCGSEKRNFAGVYDASRDVISRSGHTSFETKENHARLLDDNECWNFGITTLICHVDKVHLFRSMCKIAMKSTGQDVQVAAVSVMKMILMRSNAYTERDMLGETIVFETVGHLLRKEAGLSLQKEAVHLLYLLLNCPKILATFCSSSEYGKCTGISGDSSSDSACKVSSVILEGLANCMARSGSGTQDLQLYRNAIVVLAFLASSGKSGLEILLFHKLSDETNFLGLVLQVLASVVDAEASDYCVAPEISRERTLLIREALILLNRLASHPAYSTSVLQALTSCRDMTSLSIDIATRLSKKSRRLGLSDNITQQTRESEVVDLARVFKKRVFVFLGEAV
ncbi:hypothetical protein Ancab_015808 [Ancistrocladus abbreviatus]